MIVAKKGTTRHIPTVFPGAIRVEALSILGVTISSDLKMNQHINRVLSSASSSLYALSTLRSKGLPEGSLRPAWFGYASSKHRDKLEALIKQMKRREFLHPEDPTASDLALKADEALFRAVCTNPNHVLSSLLPRLKQHQYNLRSRVHNFYLPPKDDRNFVSRSLYIILSILYTFIFYHHPLC